MKRILGADAVKGGGSGGGGNTYTSVSGSTPLVKLYHKGEPVERIQKAVGVKVDGFYGPATASAVGEFQKDLRARAQTRSSAIRHGPQSMGARRPSRPGPRPRTSRSARANGMGRSHRTRATTAATTRRTAMESSTSSPSSSLAAGRSKSMVALARPQRDCSAVPGREGPERRWRRWNFDVEGYLVGACYMSRVSPG